MNRWIRFPFLYIFPFSYSSPHCRGLQKAISLHCRQIPHLGNDTCGSAECPQYSWQYRRNRKSDQLQSSAPFSSEHWVTQLRLLFTCLTLVTAGIFHEKVALIKMVITSPYMSPIRGGQHFRGFKQKLRVHCLRKGQAVFFQRLCNLLYVGFLGMGTVYYGPQQYYVLTWSTLAVTHALHFFSPPL